MNPATLPLIEALARCENPAVARALSKVVAEFPHATGTAVPPEGYGYTLVVSCATLAEFRDALVALSSVVTNLSLMRQRSSTHRTTRSAAPLPDRPVPAPAPTSEVPLRERLLAVMPAGTRTAMEIVLAAGPEGIATSTLMSRLGREGSAGPLVHAIGAWAKKVGARVADVVTVETVDAQYARQGGCRTVVRSPLTYPVTRADDDDDTTPVELPASAGATRLV